MAQELERKQYATFFYFIGCKIDGVIFLYVAMNLTQLDPCLYALKILHLIFEIALTFAATFFR